MVLQTICNTYTSSCNKTDHFSAELLLDLLCNIALYECEQEKNYLL